MTQREPSLELPHSGPMRLLDRVLFHDATRTVCSADPLRAQLFEDAEGRLPAWIALELMAQCAAAHGALAGPERAAGAGRALLLGARRLRLDVAALDPARPLEVEARHRAGERGLVAFDCALRDPAVGRTLAAGRLNVYTLRETATEAGRSDGS